MRCRPSYGTIEHRVEAGYRRFTTAGSIPEPALYEVAGAAVYSLHALFDELGYENPYGQAKQLVANALYRSPRWKARDNMSRLFYRGLVAGEQVAIARFAAARRSVGSTPSVSRTHPSCRR